MRLRSWITSLGIFGCVSPVVVHWAPNTHIPLDTALGIIAIFAAIVAAFFSAGVCAEIIYLKRMDTLWSRVVATLLTPILPLAIAYVPQYNSFFSFSYSDYLLKLFYVGIPAGLILGRIMLFIEPLKALEISPARAARSLRSHFKSGGVRVLPQGELDIGELHGVTLPL
jgi:hypothetical protein